MTSITVTCTKVTYFNRRSSRPLQDRTEYSCTGPDETAFKNTNRAEISRLLVRRYGPDTVLHFVAPDGSDPR